MNTFIERLHEGIWFSQPEILFPWGTPLNELWKIGQPDILDETEETSAKRKKQYKTETWEPVVIDGLSEIFKVQNAYLVSKSFNILFQGNLAYYVSNMERLEKELNTLIGPCSLIKTEIEDRGIVYVSEHKEWWHQTPVNKIQFRISTTGFDIKNDGPISGPPLWKLANHSAPH